jgi:hypothetical protein
MNAGRQEYRIMSSGAGWWGLPDFSRLERISINTEPGYQDLIQRPAEVFGL